MIGDPGFPSQHTTTTTTSKSVVTKLRFDSSYIRYKVGIIKIVQIVLNFVGFICIQTTLHSESHTGRFFSTVSMTGVWVTAILLFLYLFHVVEKFYRIPWLKFELCYCGIMAILYLITSSIAAPYGLPAFEAAAFFGFSAMVAYAIDTYFKYVALKHDELAQGERHKETTSPAY